jgi:hypothetical protein
MNQEDLINIVLKLENYREAEQALLSLKAQVPAKAKELALDILENEKGDIYFQSCAFEVIYSVDRGEALTLIRNNPSSTNLELLRVMVESVTEDSELVGSVPGLRDAVNVLEKKLATLSREELSEIADSVDWFRGSFKL